MGQVTTVTAGATTLCLVHTEEFGFTALNNRCPHQGGPLGEGQLDNGWVICPWRAYEYHPQNGEAPDGYGDCVQPYPLEIRDQKVFVQIDEVDEYAHPALVFKHLSKLAPEDAVICVDVGNNTDPMQT